MFLKKVAVVVRLNKDVTGKKTRPIKQDKSSVYPLNLVLEKL